MFTIDEGVDASPGDRPSADEHRVRAFGPIAVRTVRAASREVGLEPVEASPARVGDGLPALG
jgi:hypothetical protein